MIRCTAAHLLHPGYGCLPDIASTDPAPFPGGGGGAPQARAGWGLPASSLGSHLQGTRTGSVRYSEFWERRRQGGGTSSPSPSAPPPVAISPRSSTWGYPGEEPGTAVRRLHPGYGCLPDIATHCHRPRGGGGGGAPPARAGGGCRQKCTGIPAKGAGGAGTAGRSVWVSACKGRPRRDRREVQV